ncbi:MAG: Zn-dependent hydrolase [Alphaproteobacteria bacterium]|nr:MAG: Zn-dependent hydrolase [Alphaproteobacteria bacterium]
MTDPVPGIFVNERRLWDSLMTMGEIGALPHGGCRRLALSPEDKAGRDLFVRWCREAGCEITIDAIGNIYARRPGRNPSLPAAATGSHLDTQPHGGKFDGIYGVLAGLEVVRTLNDHQIETEAPIDVIVWTNEEAARFSPPLTGSGVYSGRYRLDEAQAQPTENGKTVRDDLIAIGYLGSDIPGDRKFKCFIEAHIEQGPILEAENCQIGIVTQIQGIRWYDVTVTGQDGHAGTVPLTLRKDALHAAAEILIALREMGLSIDDDIRLTVGRLDVIPNSGSTIPGTVNFTIDLRHPSEDCLVEVEDRIRQIIEAVATRLGVQASLSPVMSVPPVLFDPDIVNTVRRCTQELGYSHRDMLSGAGHDAMNIATCTPTGMIFIPCREGVSHNEAEYASPSAVARGANVLLRTLLAST